MKSPAGGNGTSYSGGTGAGSSSGWLSYHHIDFAIGEAGHKNGGSGGKGDREINPNDSESNFGAGAGNPGGTNGTGGTLILFANSFNNLGTITSTGSQGGLGSRHPKAGDARTPGGGGSGRWKYKYFL